MNSGLSRHAVRRVAVWLECGKEPVMLEGMNETVTYIRERFPEEFSRSGEVFHLGMFCSRRILNCWQALPNNGRPSKCVRS